MRRTIRDLCVVCFQPGAVNVRAQNALPAGIVICESCRSAVGRKEVGIVLHVTDGRVGLTRALEAQREKEIEFSKSSAP